ncbi:MAG: hypothetical protein JRN67_09915 [Nitrososphaerota archaeon]|nr:hypothetical protein [Nitrososphaerota archaeon]
MEVEEAIAALQGEAARLRSHLGKDISLPAVMSILSKYPCPDRCYASFSLEDRPAIDPFYSERHRYLQRILLDRLRLALTRAEVKARLAAEHDIRAGKGDVDVIVTRSGIDVRGYGVVIRIELKTGSNFDISQIIRYLADVNAVVACLCGRGHALVLRREGTEDHIAGVISTNAAKLQSLLVDSNDRIPGPWCSGCPVDCPDRKNSASHEVDFQAEFQAPIGKWIGAIDDAIAKTIALLRELSEPDQATEAARN